MGHVKVSIKDSHVYYSHYDKTGTQSLYGHTSTNNDLQAHMNVNPVVWGAYMTNSVLMTSDNFVRFKNGGKRLPSRNPGKTTGKQAPIGGASPPKHVRTRADRRLGLVEEGDVGTYSTGHNSLKPNIATPGLQRDHINSTAAVLLRTNALNLGAFAGSGFSDGQIRARGLTIAISDDVHKGGYTYGGKQHSVVPGSGGMTRVVYVATHPEDGFYNELIGELALYYGNGQLTYEIVGSYRYLYKLSVRDGHIHATDDLDGLIEAYLGVAS